MCAGAQDEVAFARLAGLFEDVDALADDDDAVVVIKGVVDAVQREAAGAAGQGVPVAGLARPSFCEPKWRRRDRGDGRPA